VLNTIPGSVDFIEALPDYDVSMFEHKKMKTTRENSLENLKAALKVLEEVDDWTNQALFEKLMGLVQQMEVKNSLILWPVRTAVSGKDVTPGGAAEIAEILGKEETLRRIKIGIAKLSQ
jgi:glutamyl-tRNA synthetase